MKLIDRLRRLKDTKELKKMRMKGSSKRSEGLKSISCRGMPASWKNGSRKVLKTGSRTWLTRRRENKLNWNLNTSRLRSSTILL